MAEFIRTNVRNTTRKKETATMGKTIAESLREEGMAEGLRQGELRAKRQALLRIIRNRFKSVPRAITARVQATEDVSQLDAWIDAASTAERLADVPFTPAE